MVAQQVLVLFVLVRIRVGQQKKEFPAEFLFCWAVNAYLFALSIFDMLSAVFAVEMGLHPIGSTYIPAPELLAPNSSIS